MNTVVKATVPTPFGWLITGQESFNLDSMLAFTKQLASLSKGLGTSTAIEESAPVLVSVSD